MAGNHVVTKIISESPTCTLCWRKGDLYQLWDVQEQRTYFTDNRFDYSDFHRRDEWRPVQEEETL